MVQLFQSVNGILNKRFCIDYLFKREIAKTFLLEALCVFQPIRFTSAKTVEVVGMR